VGDSVNACISFINDLAPEHLELMVRDPITVLEKIRNAGTVCVGDYTPAAVGDYATGISSTLPTGGYAKYVSGLNVDHFTKKMSVQVLTRDGWTALRTSSVRWRRSRGCLDTQRQCCGGFNEAHALERDSPRY